MWIMFALGAMFSLTCATTLFLLISKRRGGIYFWRIGRFGGSFYLAKRKAQKTEGMIPADWLGVAALTFFAGIFLTW